ncbi:hypothetical protein C0993_008525 [Termitomyces sp. T159_Od127]|nr:hypothetical protein C0993_008525 [Termitomyces sp. T159_Od127]
MTAPGPDHYPANSLGNPRPSPPITAPSPPQPPPLVASPGHHCCDHHISTGLGYHTTHSRHISAGTTHHPQPALRPPSHITIAHHRQPNLCTPHPAPAPSSPPYYHMSLHFQYETSMLHDMSQPRPAPHGPWVSPQAPAPQPATGTWA